MDIEKVKKLIAKEVLLAFGIVAAVAVSWGVLVLRNEYYKDKQKELNNEISKLTTELDSLNKGDYVTKVYRVLKENIDGFDKSEDDFRLAMHDSVYIMSTYEALRMSLDGFTTSKNDFFNAINNRIDTVSNKIKILYAAISETYELGSYDEFYDAIKDSVKRKKIFNWISEQYNLGTYQEFDAKIISSLSQNKTDSINNKILTAKTQELEKEKTKKQESLHSAVSNTWNNDKLKITVQYISLVLVILAYPLRICYFLLKWALKTVKT